MELIFTDKFLKEIGFKRQNEYTYENFDGDINECIVSEPYGRAVDIKTNGMTVLTWNNIGNSSTYFGKELESNVSLSIKKDAGTRTAFSGYVFNQEDVKFILERTW